VWHSPEKPLELTAIVSPVDLPPGAEDPHRGDFARLRRLSTTGFR
jgi:hypothetical protein